MIGAGPAGLAAAAAAAEAGADVVVLDERDKLGGQYYKQPSAGLRGRRGGARRPVPRRARGSSPGPRRPAHASSRAPRCGPAAAPRPCTRSGPTGRSSSTRGRSSWPPAPTSAACRCPAGRSPACYTTGAAQALLRAHQVVPGARILVSGQRAAERPGRRRPRPRRRAGGGPRRARPDHRPDPGGGAGPDGRRRARAGGRGRALPGLPPARRRPACSPGTPRSGSRATASSSGRSWPGSTAPAGPSPAPSRPSRSTPSASGSASCRRTSWPGRSACGTSTTSAAASWPSSTTARAGRPARGSGSSATRGGTGGAKLAEALGFLAGARRRPRHRPPHPAGPAGRGAPRHPRAGPRRALPARPVAAVRRAAAARPARHRRHPDLPLRGASPARRSRTRWPRTWPAIGALKRLTRAGMGRCQGRYCAGVLAAMAQRGQADPLGEQAWFAPAPPFKPVPVGALASGYANRAGDSAAELVARVAPERQVGGDPPDQRPAGEPQVREHRDDEARRARQLADQRQLVGRRVDRRRPRSARAAPRPPPARPCRPAPGSRAPSPRRPAARRRRQPGRPAAADQERAGPRLLQRQPAAGVVDAGAGRAARPPR